MCLPVTVVSASTASPPVVAVWPVVSTTTVPTSTSSTLVTSVRLVCVTSTRPTSSSGSPLSTSIRYVTSTSCESIRIWRNCGLVWRRKCANGDNMQKRREANQQELWRIAKILLRRAIMADLRLFFTALVPRPRWAAWRLPERPEDRCRPRHRPPAPRLLQGSWKGPSPPDPRRRPCPLRQPWRRGEDQGRRWCCWARRISVDSSRNFWGRRVNRGNLKP